MANAVSGFVWIDEFGLSLLLERRRVPAYIRDPCDPTHDEFARGANRGLGTGVAFIERLGRTAMATSAVDVRNRPMLSRDREPRNRFRPSARSVSGARRVAHDAHGIRVKRVYDPAEAGDGARFLVERLWPRGIRKRALKLDGWLKEVAPSDGLRRWFHHDPSRWHEFRRRYMGELSAQSEALQYLLEAARRGPITLLYAARDRQHNSAVALRDYLRRKLRSRGHDKRQTAKRDRP
jgi:uncharacterized protein YeaO (DUF488 family)